MPLALAGFRPPTARVSEAARRQRRCTSNPVTLSKIRSYERSDLPTYTHCLLVAKYLVLVIGSQYSRIAREMPPQCPSILRNTKIGLNTAIMLLKTEKIFQNLEFCNVKNFKIFTLDGRAKTRTDRAPSLEKRRWRPGLAKRARRIGKRGSGVSYIGRGEPAGSGRNRLDPPPAIADWSICFICDTILVSSPTATCARI